MTKKELPENYKELYNKFCNEDETGLNYEDGRYMAYNKCKEAFEKYCNGGLDDEVMALHLYAFLSSWGMTTHKQYLMNKNYTCLTDVVKTLKNNYHKWSKFNHEFCPDKSKESERKDYANTVINMKEKIIEALGGNGLPKGASCVLISKIIMVTYGCVIAFDSKVKEVWRDFGYKIPNNTTKDLDKDSNKNFLNAQVLEDLYDYVADNRESLLNLISDNNYSDKNYSVFKKLDMILWEYGK